MPCYTVNTMTVEFIASNRSILDAAIAALGWTTTAYANKPDRLRVWSTDYADIIELDFTAKTASSSNQKVVNELKRAYSREAIKTAARLKSWQNQHNSTTNKGIMYRY